MRHAIRVSVVALLVLTTLGGAGCTRRFFRQASDVDAEALLTEKNRFPAWGLEQFHVYPDPAARFADPSNPDRPPKPPDDYAASVSAPNPQPGTHVGTSKFEGTAYLDLMANWDQANRLAAAEVAKTTPPTIDATDCNRPFLLTVEQIVQLGLLNSREFQSRREDVFLTALPVSLERFAFAPQAFLTEQAVRQSVGADIGGPSETWRSNTDLSIRKLFPTGALLLVRYANQLVINLGGAVPRVTSVGDLNLDIVQPLLRGGGWAVTLEALTQAERNLLYAIRAFARFRKEFYVSIAGGGDISGLPFGAQNASASLLNRLAPTEGYLPTLLRVAVLTNEKQNVTALEEILRRFRAFKGGGEVSELQVGQVEQQLLSSRSTVLQRDLDVRDALDRFKLQLGLPVTLNLELDDTPLRPVIKQAARYAPVLAQLEDGRRQAETLSKVEPEQLRARLRELLRNIELVKDTRFPTQFAQQWAEWERLTDEQLQQRLTQLEEEERQIEQQQVEREKSGALRAPELDQRIADLNYAEAIGELERLLREYAKKPWAKLGAEAAANLRETLFNDIANKISILITAALDEKLTAIRASWPTLPKLCVEGVDLLTADLTTAQAVVARTALDSRFDLLNARAQLVDSWRQIAVRANALMGVFDVRYNLSSTTPSDAAKPFAFSADRSRSQLILTGELPLVRRLERNQYRAALIGYQRSRRALMAAEDFVVNDVRSTLRTLRVAAENYTIQQRQLELAYLQVDNSSEVFNAPPEAGRGGASAGNAAALTRQLLDAQRSLPAAQNQLYTVWINYQISRLNLYRDLERMPLDGRGLWDDAHTACECPPNNTPAP
jgi:outer membrane protein TolC